MLVEKTILSMVDREEDQNPLRVVVVHQAPSRGMKRTREFDNSNFDKELAHLSNPRCPISFTHPNH